MAAVVAAAMLAVPVMATAALTITNKFDAPENVGFFKVMVSDITIGTYATGGVALAPGAVGMSTIYFVDCGADTARTRLITTKWISSTGNIMCFYNAVQDSVGGTTKHVGTRVSVGTEVANGWTLSTCTVRAMIWGR
jgi:hypothetical protein